MRDQAGQRIFDARCSKKPEVGATILIADLKALF